MIGIIIIIAIVVIVLLILVVLFSTRKSLNKHEKPSLKGVLDTLTPEQAEIFNNGQAQLSDLKKQFIKLKNPDVRTAGMNVCGKMTKIFSILKEKPEKIASSRQFLNYYIPTINNVIKKYQRLEANGVPADDMTEKVLHYLSDVDIAMEKQASHLYEDDKFDMSVDMEAMTNAIKRDGLLDDDFTPSGIKSAQPVQKASEAAPVTLTAETEVQPPELETPKEDEGIKLTLPEEPLFTTDDPLFTTEEKEAAK